MAVTSKWVKPSQNEEAVCVYVCVVKRKDKKTMFTLFVDSREISHLSLSLNTVVHPAAKSPPQQFLSLSSPFNIDDSHRIK